MPEKGLLPVRNNFRNQWLFFGLSLLFVLANSLFIFFGFYVFSLLPLALLLVLLAFISLEKIFFVIVFFVPVSIQLKEFFPDLGMNLYLPTEPLLFLVLALFIAKLLLENDYPKEILLHPVSIAIYFHLVWMTITSASSSLPLVSFKFLLTRLWFIVGFYFVAILVFRKPDHFRKFILIYGSAMVIVIVYALINHAQQGLINQKAAHGASDPFFNDHTSYGAILAMLIPVFTGLASRLKTKIPTRVLLWLTVILFLVALTFSYSRAAWISLVVAIVVFLLIRFRVKFSLVALTGILAILILSFYWGDIVMKLEQNRQDSSTSFSEHVQSVSNISTDASNLERINRWTSALRMFKERPFLGWGPGTYMFQYAGFQSSREKTIISTNFGDRGNSHSEYIGPLAESGVLGTLSFVLLLVVTFYTGFRYYNRNRDRSDAWIALAASLGMLTYAVHGFLNNFLDTDKASALFWGYMAVIVTLDLYGNHKRSYIELDSKDRNIIKNS
jgi:O-antigen ligase